VAKKDCAAYTRNIVHFSVPILQTQYLTPTFYTLFLCINYCSDILRFHFLAIFRELLEDDQEIERKMSVQLFINTNILQLVVMKYYISIASLFPILIKYILSTEAIFQKSKKTYCFETAFRKLREQWNKQQ
jgi:hypothetical protein